jgi:hypothetical protein
MGYTAIPLIASIALALHHVVATEAPRLSKMTITLVIVSSLVFSQYFPRWSILATVVQAAASVYMLLYLKVRFGK